MLKVITINVNGIRSATRKGLADWLKKEAPDVLCVQELKAQEEEIPKEITLGDSAYSYFHCAQKKGYSGCAVYSKVKPDEVKLGFGAEEFDREGRYVELRFKNLIVVSVYFPSGSASEDRQASKFRFLDAFPARMQELQKDGREVLLCGDFNIAHKEIDIKNWKGNLKNSGFLPEERAWLTDRLNEGWKDIFRLLNPNPDEFTWWSNRGRARENNVGWRIDYQYGTEGIALKASSVSVYRDERFSDHAPLIVGYDFDIGL